MINKSKNENAKSFSQFTGLANRFLAVLFVAAMLFGCDTGSRGDVDSEKDNKREDAVEKTETESGGSEETGSSRTTTVTDAGDDIEPDSGVDTTIEPEPPEYTTALVITTDFRTGSYATIALDDHTVEKDIDFIHSDAVCRFDLITETPFIILRLGSDAIDVLNPDTFEIDEEYSVQPSSNPYDIAVVSADRAYISRFGSTEMLIVEPFTGAEIGKVDFGEYADDDGIPEVAGMSLLDGKVYTLVQRIDQDNNWAPAGASYLVVIDAESGKIEDDFELTGTNPYESLIYSEALDKFVISEAGDFSDLENAGVELFDPVAQTLSGFIVTEEALGGNVTKALVVSETKGYALIGVQSENGNDSHIVIFNPETGKKTGTLLKTDKWDYNNIVLSPDLKELWVADRTLEKPGIRIFDTETDEEKTDAPIDVGLPPSSICFTL